MCRLTVGWYWEIWLASFFTLVTEEDNLTEKENIGINLIIAIIIILVAFSAHYCIKEWGDYDLLAVEEAQEEGQGQQELTATTSVDNPIQSEAMTDRDNSTVAKTNEA